MEKIAILIESTSYLTKKQQTELNIKVIYLNTIVEGVAYKELIDMPMEKYVNYLQSEGAMPTTSQPAIGEVVATLEKLRDEGYTDVIAIALSSGISGTFSSYSVANLMVDGINVHPFDSEVSCQAEGFYAIKTAQLISEGKTSTEIIEELNKMKKVSKAYFVVDDLIHLQRGGRLSGAQALVGNLLQVKPILHFEDKVIVPFQKIRTYKKAIARIYELFEDFYSEHSEENINVCILHVEDDEKASEMEQFIKEKYPNVVITVGNIGPVISTHLGIGAVALGWTII